MPAPSRARSTAASDERRRKRRRALIESALGHFAASGYAGSPIEQICQDAGVGYKAFYDEFGSKEDLFVAVYDHVSNLVLTSVMAEFGPDVPADDRPGVLVRAYIRAVLADPRYSRILFVLSSGISEAVELHKRQAELTIAGYLSDLYLQGHLRSVVDAASVDARLVGVALTGAITLLVVDHVLDDERTDVEALADDVWEFVELVFVGIEARDRTDRGGQRPAVDRRGEGP